MGRPRRGFSSGRPHQPNPWTPTPGLPPGMHHYVVNLTEVHFPKDAHPGRAEVYRTYTNHAAGFVGHLRDVLARKGLGDQVAGFGEVGGLPIVTLTCTPAVAKLIETMPGVTGVYADDSGTFALV